MWGGGKVDCIFEKLDPHTICLLKHLEFVSVHFRGLYRPKFLNIFVSAFYKP